MPEPLHLVRLTLDAAALVARGRRQGLSLRDVDEGYLVHAWVCAALGEGGLAPWVIERSDGRSLRLLGYATRDAAALQAHADTFAMPDDHAAIDWASLATKPMPEAFAPGRRLGIRARVCPTRRNGSTEKDAFLMAVAGQPEDAGITREAVYAAWLSDAVGRLGAGTVDDVRMVDFRLSPMLRRTQGAARRSHFPLMPDATLEATLTVGPQGIGDLLRRGLGRHRAFGYGMVLLTPPRSP